MHAAFQGFQQGEGVTPIPTDFFRAVLPHIDDLAELKLTLFCMWALTQQPGPYRHLREADLTGAAACQVHGLSGEAAAAALARALDRGTLLRVDVGAGPVVMANSPAGRDAADRLRAGEALDLTSGAPLLPPRPGLFTLYEQNIGPLTPLIAQELQDMAAEFGTERLVEAIRLSVHKEKRSLHYVRGILKKWRQEGFHDEPTRRPTAHRRPAAPDDGPSDRLSGPYADFFDD